MKPIKIKNSFGKNIAAVIHYPKEQTGLPATPFAARRWQTDRLAILCPGYLDTKDYQHLIMLAEELAGDGYTVVRFDPTGTWESEGDISDYTTTQYLNDIRSVIKYMLSEGSYKFILISGHSRGGMVSILYAARDRRISAVVGIMPSSGRKATGKRREDWEKDGFSISIRDIPNKTRSKTETKEFRVPFSHVLDRERYNVVEEAKNVGSPLIFIAGELDTVVLPQHVKEIFDMANEPKKFILLKKIGHDYRYNPDEIKIVNGEIIKCLRNI